jgi:hypothetical protein
MERVYLEGEILAERSASGVTRPSEAAKKIWKRRREQFYT